MRRRGENSLRRAVRRGLVVLASTCVAASLMVGSAWAKAGPAVYAPDAAGYSATGAYFDDAGIYVTLPNASRFAAEVGQIGISLQLWSSDLVADYQLVACTTSTCKAGGRPEVRRYRQVFSLYNRRTRALLCTTWTATAKLRCPGSRAAYEPRTFAAGSAQTIFLQYDRRYGFIDANGYADYQPGTGLRFNQARIVAQFGSTPWSKVRFRAPPRPVLITDLGIPPPPPYMAEISTYGGKYATCLSSWWTRHKVKMTARGTAAAAEAAPEGLWQGSCDFGLYLEPRR
jgi:hypothetical protein